MEGVGDGVERLHETQGDGALGACAIDGIDVPLALGHADSDDTG